MRRSIYSLMLAISLVLFGSLPVVQAQDATPTSGFDDLGLPTLDVTVGADSYEGIPESLEAGRYLVTVIASEEAGEFGGGVAFVQPTGMSADDYLSLMMSGPTSETGGPAASSTPMGGPDATPAEGDPGADAAGGMDGPPAALFEALFAGGAYALPGQTAQIVLDLPPGEWIAWADDPEAPQAPVIFEVTGEMPADLVEPDSGATITMGEYMIAVSEGQLTAGTQVVKIENNGAQPHFIVDFIVPEGTTEEQIATILDEEVQAEMSGTPVVYSGLNPETDFAEGSLFTGSQSPGTTIWVPVTLEAGTHGLACFFPDIRDGTPHAYYGMYTIVEVGE